MAEFYYEVENNEILLFQIEAGIVVSSITFKDREDMLLYLEQHFDKVKLYID